jgi:hypothetical protein
MCVCVCEGKTKAQHKNSEQVLSRTGKVQIFGNNINRSKLHEQRDEEQTKFGECLLPFDPESSVFLPAV